MGDLAANDERVVDDNCVAPGADWYGNARPIFINKLVFALLGCELVEGALREAAIEEIGRVSFGPARSARTGVRP